MAVVLVDSNVVLDATETSSIWNRWAVETLEGLDEENRFVINSVIYAEVSIGFESIEEVEALFAHLAFEILEIPREALFLAGKAFLRYRRERGSRTGVLPDFFIGAHAAVRGFLLLTRDTRRFSTYFPTVTLFSPHSSGRLPP